MSNNKTIGELLDEARKKSGTPKLAGHDIMALERFAPDTRHMIVFDVLTHNSPVGWKGKKCRAFLTDQGYQKSLENERLGHIKIRNHTKVVAGHLHYDTKSASCKTTPKEVDIHPFNLPTLVD